MKSATSARPLPKLPTSNRSSYLSRHEEREQNLRREFWRKLGVRCILADVRHGYAVDKELVEWAERHKNGHSDR